MALDGIVMSPHPCCSMPGWSSAERCGMMTLWVLVSCANQPTERQRSGAVAPLFTGAHTDEQPNESIHSMRTKRTRGAQRLRVRRRPMLRRGRCVSTDPETLLTRAVERLCLSSSLAIRATRAEVVSQRPAIGLPSLSAAPKLRRGKISTFLTDVSRLKHRRSAASRTRTRPLQETGSHRCPCGC